MDTRNTIRRIEAGDHSAFAELVARFERPLFGYLGRMGLAQGPAEELAQETFLRAWRQLGRYDPARGALSTWLFTLARNLALNELERHPQGREIRDEEAAERVACERSTPDILAGEAQRRRQLQSALRRLPLQDRSVLALIYLKELDVASVAAIEGCTAGAVKVRLHRARARLRELLEATHGR